MYILAICIVFILTLVGSILLYYYESPISTIYVAIPGVISMFVLSVLKYRQYITNGYDTVHLPEPSYELLNNTPDELNNINERSHSSTKYVSLNNLMDENDKKINNLQNDLLNNTVDTLLKDKFEYINITDAENLSNEIKKTFNKLLNAMAIDGNSKLTMLKSKDKICNDANDKLIDDIYQHNTTFQYGYSNENNTNYVDLPIIHDDEELKQIYIDDLIHDDEEIKQIYIDDLNDVYQIINAYTITNQKLADKEVSSDNKLILIIKHLLEYNNTLGSIFMDDVIKIINAKSNAKSNAIDNNTVDYSISIKKELLLLVK